MSNITFPLANPIRLNDNTSGEWWYDSIPYFEQKFKYCQKFQQLDTLVFQYTVRKSVYVSSLCEIIDTEGKVLHTITVHNLTDTYDSNYYQCQAAQLLTVITDNTKCFVKLTITLNSGPVVYISEPLWIKALWANTLKIDYSHDENDFNIIFFDNLYGTDSDHNQVIMTIRVEGGLKSDSYTPASDDNIYKNDRSNFRTVHSTPYLIKKFIFGDSKGIPHWLADKINRAFSCYYSQINGVYYNKINNAKYDRQGTDLVPLAAWTLELVEDEDMNGFSNFPFPMSRIYYLFRGVIPLSSTDPGIPTEDIYYMAPVDFSHNVTYTNFGGLTVNKGEQAALRWDTTDNSWHKDVFGTTTLIKDFTINQTLREGTRVEIDVAGAGIGTLIMHQIFKTEDKITYPVPGILLEYDDNDGKYYISAKESCDVIIKLIGYE